MSSPKNVKIVVALLASFLVIFIWQFFQLTALTVPLFGGAIFIYMLSSVFRKKDSQTTDESITVFTVTIITLLLIFMTGQLASHLFFLLYFLSFAIAFLAKPQHVFIFTALSILVFLPQLAEGDILTHGIKLASLLLISPIAYFLGRAFQQLEKDEKKIQELEETSFTAAEKIKHDVAEIIRNEGQVLKKQDIASLKDIVDQTDELEKK